MKIPRVAVIAVTTAIGLAGVTNAVLPTPDKATPAGHERELQREYKETYGRQLAEARTGASSPRPAARATPRRSRATASATAEHRPPPDAAQVIRTILRKG